MVMMRMTENKENWLYSDASGLYFVHDGFIMRATDGKQYDIEEECDLLNELSDKNRQLEKENEQLKSELGEKDIQIDFLKSENIHMSDLVNENNQLKSELKALRKKYNDFSDMVDKRLKEMDRGLVR